MTVIHLLSREYAVSEYKDRKDGKFSLSIEFEIAKYSRKNRQMWAWVEESKSVTGIYVVLNAMQFNCALQGQCLEEGKCYSKNKSWRENAKNSPPP